MNTGRNGEITEYNIAYFELLQNMTWLESQVGTSEKVAEYSAKVAALKEVINFRLFNEDTGLYQYTGSQPNVFPLTGT